MTLGQGDFYFDIYRSVTGQIEIIKLALQKGEEEIKEKLARLEARDAKLSRWLQNVKTYLGTHTLICMNSFMFDLTSVYFQDALMEGVLADVRVHKLKAEGNVTDEELGNLVEVIQSKPVNFNENDEEEEKEEEDEEGEDEDGPEQPPADATQRILYPRSEKCFYKRILKGMRMWKRPDHDDCSRCGAFTKTSERVKALTAALLATEEDAEFLAAADLIRRAGGQQKAWQEQREATLLLPGLKKHVLWKQSQRGYVKWREVHLTEIEAMLYLDYGGMQDSGGKKLSVWSVTVKAFDREEEHFDFFFDALDKRKGGHEGAKKNGSTGIFFLAELFDPARGPDPEAGKERQSLFHSRFPKVRALILSGDTGNGYRAYGMLEELSTLFLKWKLNYELISLAPGHAWNPTDGRIAHMNTFLRAIRRSSRIFGAEAVARAFQLASNPKISQRRKFLARSFVFFRVVTSEWTTEAVTKFEKDKGAQLQDVRLPFGGHVGVHGLLYFKFSFDIADGSVQHHPGFASVREYGDPNRVGNPTYVYTWRQSLAKLMCQHCSNDEERPVMLTEYECTKKQCAKEQERLTVRNQRLASLPNSFPLRRSAGTAVAAGTDAAAAAGTGAAAAAAAGTDAAAAGTGAAAAAEESIGAGTNNESNVDGEWRVDEDANGEKSGDYFQVDFKRCQPKWFAAILEETGDDSQASISIKQIVAVVDGSDDDNTFSARSLLCTADPATSCCLKSKWHKKPTNQLELCNGYSVICFFPSMISKGTKLPAKVVNRIKERDLAWLEP